MEGMFYECSALNTIYVGNNWIIKDGINIQDMFLGCGTNETTPI